MPIFGQMIDTLSSIDESIRIDEDFFSVAITMPFEAGMAWMILHMSQWSSETVRGLTLDTKTGCSLGHSC